MKHKKSLIVLVLFSILSINFATTINANENELLQVQAQQQTIAAYFKNKQLSPNMVLVQDKMVLILNCFANRTCEYDVQCGWDGICIGNHVPGVYGRCLCY